MTLLTAEAPPVDTVELLSEIFLEDEREFSTFGIFWPAVAEAVVVIDGLRAV